MHLSHKHPRPAGWAMGKTQFDQSILCNVGKGWFSLSEYRERGWPFCSYPFSFGQSRTRSAATAPYILHAPTVPSDDEECSRLYAFLPFSQARNSRHGSVVNRGVRV